MVKIKRANFLFVTFKGDHTPRHVHVFKDDRIVLKWDLEHDRLLSGVYWRKVVDIIAALVEEGRL
jgi:hypothetical protein